MAYTLDLNLYLTYIISMNSIEWTKKAVKQLRKLQRPDQQTIFAQTQTLANWPNCQNVKSLSNHKHPYRLRVGRFRVFFDVDSDVKIVKIEEVKKRDENTY